MRQEIKRCQKEDIPLLFKLFKTAYQFNPRLQERDYFDWQFKSTPFSEDDDYSFWVLWQESEIIGCLGYVPIQFRYCEEISKGCMTHLWHTVSKDTSGLKLLSRLMTDYDNRFLIGLTEESNSIYQMYRIPLLKEMPRWIAIINPDRVIQLFNIVDNNDRQQIINGYELFRENENTFGIYRCERFDPEEEFLLNEWASIKGYCRRTGKYLNWRYIDIPRHNYQVIRGDNNQFAVYRIERIKDHSESVVRIVEWNFKYEWSQRALTYIRQKSDSQNAILFDFFCTANEVGLELNSLGFIPEEIITTRIPYLFRPICHSDGISLGIDMPPHRVKRSLDFNEWYITKGDSDIDRIKL